MKRFGKLGSGHILTTGEKALLVMVVAGIFGYWAGFNVSSTNLPDPFPAAVAAAPQPASPPPEPAIWVPSSPGPGKWVPDPQPYRYVPTTSTQPVKPANPANPQTVTVTNSAGGVPVLVNQ